MKRLVATIAILILTCFLLAGCDVVDSAIDGVNSSKHDINNAIIGLFSHTHNYVENIVTPTCENQGYTTFTCECGESYVDDYVDALGHSEVIDAAVPATCTTTGLTEGKHCARCNEVIVAQQTVEVSHDYVNYICRVCGATAYSKGLEYISKGDGTCYVFGIGTCTDTDIVIPHVSPDGETVVKIGSNAFAETYRITSITIPDGVTTIGENAFYGCPDLTSVTIPDTVTSICGGAFWNCKLLTDITIPDSVTSLAGGVFAGCSSLTSMTIPDGVTFIGGYTFYACSNLSSVSIGKGVGYIDYAAFLDCYRLTSITIPGSVTSIGDVAFSGCSSLSSVTIPDSVTSIGGYAFEGCTSLTTIYYAGTLSDWNEIEISENVNFYLIGATRYYYSETMPTEEGNFWLWVDGVPTVWEEYIDLEYSNGLEYRLSGDGTYYTVTGIGTYKGRNLIIPAEYNGLPVKEIASNAFADQTQLVSITIPETIVDFGAYAFNGCTNVTSLYYNAKHANPMGDGYNISYFVFGGLGSDTAGTTVYIGPNVENIPDHMFSAFMGGMYIGSNSVKSVVFDEQSKCTEIGLGAFYECYLLVEISIPNSVTSIGNSAFSGCTSLTSVTIPNSVTSIGNSAFYDCSSLTSVTILDGVTSIGNSAFYGCSSLASIAIPDSVTSIGERAFSGCSSLTGVYITDIVEWCSISFTDYSSNPLNYAENLYLNGELVTNLAILEGATSISRYAFCGYSSFTDIVIPDSVTSIGDYAFKGCSNLKSVVIPETVTYVGLGAFAYSKHTIIYCEAESKPDGWSSEWNSDTQITNTYYRVVWAYTGDTGVTEDGFSWASVKTGIAITGYTGNERDVAIPSQINGCDVTVICDSAFNQMNSISGSTFINSVVIPDSITYIGDYAFDFLNLTTIYYSGTSSDWNEIEISENGNSYLIGATRYYYSETMPTEEGNFWLWVDGVPVSWDVYNAPAYSVGLKYTSNGNGTCYVSGIGTCTDTDIVIPCVSPEGWTVVGIGDYAFYSCSSLVSVTIPDSVTSIGEYAFYGCTSLASVVIPDGVTSISDGAFSGCSSLNSVTIGNGVTSIGAYAFYKCSSLTTIYYAGTSSDWNEIEISENGNSHLFAATIYYYSEMEPTEMGNFWHYVDGEPTVWEDYIDRGYSYGLEYQLSSDGTYYAVTGIGTYKGTQLVIPAEHNGLPVKEIASYAFADQTQLVSITIPETIVDFGFYAFNGCTNVTTLYYNARHANPMGSSGQSYIVFGGLGHDTEGATVYIGPNVEKIPEHMLSIFMGGSDVESNNITSIVFDEQSKCTEIGFSAFEGCASLAEISIPNSVTSIGDYAFTWCSSLTSITIPDSVTSIGNGAFDGCTSLTSITIPDSVTSIGKYAFSHCTSLTNIDVDPDNSYYKSIDGNLYTKDGKEFVQYANGKTDTTFMIPDGVTSIGERAFSVCTSLTSVTIPDSVTSIGYEAFFYCTNLTSVTIGNSLTSISEGAFYCCTSLTSVTIGNSLTSIGEYAFYKCSSLTTINYRGTEEEWYAINKDSYWDRDTGNYTIVYNYTGE